jgi:hypothetical protein
MADKPQVNPVPWVIVTPHGGSREGVKSFVSQQVANGMDGKPAADQTGIEAAKALIANRIDSLPEEFNSVEVRADGRQRAGYEEIHVYVEGRKTL